MRTPALLFCFAALFSCAAYAQGGSGSISGSVLDPGGAAVAKAAVQARNMATGAAYRTSSSAAGKYDIANLPPGSYSISVSIAGLKPYSRQGVAVQAGKTSPLDIHIEESTQLSTLGEDAAHFAADLKDHAPPSGPTPRTADGKPDLSGVWWSPRTVDPGRPQWLPDAVKVARERAANNRRDSPQSHCLPAAVLRLGPLYQFVQSRDFLIEMSDDDYPGFHQIYLDGRKHPADPNPAWYGDNIGHWEGDTLVVDRVAFDDRVWLDQELHPHSPKLHVIERYRRPDLGHLETSITVEDPGILAKPWITTRVSDLAPDQVIHEFICNEDEKDVQHFSAK